MTMFVMTLGEMNYHDNFLPWDNLSFATLTNVLFIVLVLGMPIIMMNMLVRKRTLHYYVGSTTSRCSGKEPKGKGHGADTRERRKSGLIIKEYRSGRVISTFVLHALIHSSKDFGLNFRNFQKWGMEVRKRGPTESNMAYSWYIVVPILQFLLKQF